MSNENLRRVLLCLFAALIVFGIWFLNHEETRDTNRRIDRVESPCLKYGTDSKICEKSFSAAIEAIKPYQVCIIFHMVGENPRKCEQIEKKQDKKQQERKEARSFDELQEKGLGKSPGNLTGDDKEVAQVTPHGSGGGTHEPPKGNAPHPEPGPNNPGGDGGAGSGNGGGGGAGNPGPSSAPGEENSQQSGVVDTVTDAVGSAVEDVKETVKGLTCPPLGESALGGPVLGC